MRAPSDERLDLRRALIVLPEVGTDDPGGEVTLLGDAAIDTIAGGVDVRLLPIGDHSEVHVALADAQPIRQLVVGVVRDEAMDEVDGLRAGCRPGSRRARG